MSVNMTRKNTGYKNTQVEISPTYQSETPETFQIKCTPFDTSYNMKRVDGMRTN